MTLDVKTVTPPICLSQVEARGNIDAIIRLSFPLRRSHLDWIAVHFWSFHFRHVSFSINKSLARSNKLLEISFRVTNGQKIR